MSKYDVFIGPEGNRVFHASVNNRAAAFKAIIDHGMAMHDVYAMVGNDAEATKYANHANSVEAEWSALGKNKMKRRENGLLYSCPIGSIR